MITCYMPFCPTPDTGAAEAARTGCARATAHGQGRANFKCCLRFHMTLQESRHLGSSTH